MRLATPIILILTLTILIILFVPPNNFFIIFFFIFVLSLLISLIIKRLSSHKYAIISFFAIFILLSQLALQLFNIINILLTAGFVIGLYILMTDKDK